jgi:hypothetical protein
MFPFAIGDRERSGILDTVTLTCLSRVYRWFNLVAPQQRSDGQKGSRGHRLWMFRLQKMQGQGPGLQCYRCS